MSKTVLYKTNHDSFKYKIKSESQLTLYCVYIIITNRNCSTKNHYDCLSLLGNSQKLVVILLHSLF
jgi:hypothetical protein